MNDCSDCFLDDVRVNFCKRREGCVDPVVSVLLFESQG